MKQLSMYNKGKQYSAKWWKDFITILITNNYIEEKKMSSGFGSVLKCSKAGINLFTEST